MQRRIATSLARLYVSSPLLSFVLFVGGFFVYWSFIIAYILDSQLFNAWAVLTCAMIVHHYINRAVLPIVKSIKAER